MPLLLIAAIFGSLAWGENPVIGQLVKKYQAIVKAEKKMTRTEPDFGDSDNVEVFREKGVVKEIREEFPSELIVSKYKYFFDKDKAFYVVEERTNFAQPMMTEMEGLPKPIQAETTHVYIIDKGRMLKWTESGKEIKKGTERFSKRESEILDLAEDALENTR